MSGYKPPSGSSGTTDHSLLSNLDYDGSGHTGFVPDLHDDDNQIPFYSGGWGVIDVSNFALTFLDDADASAVRATLGLAIGTNVQAYDAELAAIAGLASAADKAPYFTGSGSAALMDVSSFARTVLDDTTAAAACATLGAEQTANKGAASGYAGLGSAQEISVADYTQQTAKTEVAWSSGVAITVEPFIPATNGDYYLEINYWIERIVGGASRRGGLWRFLLRRTGGTLSILQNGDSGPIGPFAPTQAWAVSGDDLTWTITDATNSGQVAYFARLFKCGDLTT